jgi:hypothetical protein
MAFHQERHQGVFQHQHKAPENELPTALPTPELTWAVPGGVLAIPVLLVYSAGFELLIMYRSREPQPRDLGVVQQAAEQLRGLRVNGHAVELHSGDHGGRGFTYLAWYQLRPGEPASAEFGLDWPGTEHRMHLVPLIQEAAAQATPLWTGE